MIEYLPALLCLLLLWFVPEDNDGSNKKLSSMETVIMLFIILYVYQHNSIAAAQIPLLVYVAKSRKLNI